MKNYLVQSLVCRSSIRSSSCRNFSQIPFVNFFGKNPYKREEHFSPLQFINHKIMLHLLLFNTHISFHPARRAQCEHRKGGKMKYFIQILEKGRDERGKIISHKNIDTLMILPSRKTKKYISKISCLEKSQKQKNKSLMSWNYIDNSRQLLRRRPFMISPVSPSIPDNEHIRRVRCETLDRDSRQEGKRIESNETKWSFFDHINSQKIYMCIHLSVGCRCLLTGVFFFLPQSPRRTAHHRAQLSTISTESRRTFRKSNRHFSCSRNEDVKATPSQLFSYSFFSPLPYTFSVCQIDKLSCEFRRLADCISLTSWGSYEAAHVSFFFFGVVVPCPCWEIGSCWF